MSQKTAQLKEDLGQIVGDVKGVADALTTDPKAQQRKELGWKVLYGGMAAASTIVARKLATRSWHVLTGEAPPPGGTKTKAKATATPSAQTAAETADTQTSLPPVAAPPVVVSAPARDTSASHESAPPKNTSPSAEEEQEYEAAHGRPLPDEAPSPQPERHEEKLEDPGIRDLSKQDWIAVFKRAGKETLDDNIPMIASALAYASFFAIPSVLLVAVGLFTVVAGPDTIDSLMQHFRTFMPGDATKLLDQSLSQLEAKPSSGILMTVVGFVLAVWSTTGAMNSYMTALNIAYDRKDTRTFVQKRVVALKMAGAIAFAFALIAVLLIFGPAVEHWVGTTLHIQPVLQWVWWLGQWPLLVAGLLAAFATTYWLGPDVDHPRWRFLTVGSALAVVVWLAASGLFAVYTSTFASYNKTWGSLSAVIVMLTWLWLTALALLFGAEVNAEVERSRELRKGEPAEDELQVSPA